MTHTETPADQLRAAKALIDTPDKWTQGQIKDFVGGQECYCALGALWEVQGASSWRERLDDPAYLTLSSVLPRTGGSVGAFNDQPTTAHADIMALFDRAIALAEKSA